MAVYQLKSNNPGIILEIVNILFLCILCCLIVLIIYIFITPVHVQKGTYIMDFIFKGIVCFLIFSAIVIILYRVWVAIKTKNNFVINTDNDLFYFPKNNKPFCKLSDLENIRYYTEEIKIKSSRYTIYCLEITGKFGTENIKFSEGASLEKRCMDLYSALKNVIGSSSASDILLADNDARSSNSDN